MGWWATFSIHRYNKKTSKQLGWKPEWFGSHDFDDRLIKNIKKFQKLHSLTADGKVGPLTYKRVLADRDVIGMPSHIICKGS